MKKSPSMSKDTINVQIARLETSFNNFKEQDSKDKALIRADIKELSDGVVNRIDIVEKKVEDRYTKFEFGTFMSDSHAPLVQEVGTNTESINGLRRWRAWITGGVGILAIVVLPILGWLLVSVVNHEADDKANQVTVAQIQNTYNGINQTIANLQTELQAHINSTTK